MLHTVAVLVVVLASCFGCGETRNASSYVKSGVERHQKGHYDKAITDFTEAIRIDPEHTLAYLNRGIAWIEKGESEKAIVDFDMAIRFDPTDADTFYSRGIAWENIGDFDRAIADYSEAIRLNSENVEAYNNRGGARIDRNKGDDQRKGISDYCEAIRIDPGYAPAYFNRGIVLGAKGEFDRAIADYSEAIRLDPKLRSAYVNRGIVWYGKGNYERAIEDYNEAIRLDQKDAKTFVELVWILVGCPDAKYRNGRKAIEVAKKSCELTGYKSAINVAALAAAYSESGEFREAIRWQEKAVDLAVEKEKPEYRHYLELYKQGKPYRDGRSNEHHRNVRPHPTLLSRNCEQ